MVVCDLRLIAYPCLAALDLDIGSDLGQLGLIKTTTHTHVGENTTGDGSADIMSIVLCLRWHVVVLRRPINNVA